MRRKILVGIAFLVLIALSFDVKQVYADCKIVDVIQVFQGTVKVIVNNQNTTSKRTVEVRTEANVSGEWMTQDKQTLTIDPGKNGTTRGLSYGHRLAKGYRVFIIDDTKQNDTWPLAMFTPVGGFSIPIDNGLSSGSFGMLAPYACSVLSIVATATIAGFYVKRAKRKRQK